jgi:hypothetical protein
MVSPWIRCSNWDWGNNKKGNGKFERAVHIEECKARCKKHDDCQIREQKQVEISLASEQPQTPLRKKLVTRGKL